jgi:hypothetical protein
VITVRAPVSSVVWLKRQAIAVASVQEAAITTPILILGFDLYDYLLNHTFTNVPSRIVKVTPSPRSYDPPQAKSPDQCKHLSRNASSLASHARW